MATLAISPASQVRQASQPDSPDELDTLQRTFDRVCTWSSIARYGRRAEQLSWHIVDQFREGLTDEDALFESAIWFGQNSGASQYHSDA
ncbi:hypothetical protein N185_32725 [Sinorhizobium sp. GW3]|nr:hypothetical protein N185_32725 [Sinorhizobium sp. GW3]